MKGKGMVQACGALAMYVAIVSAHLVGFSPIEFALLSAALLCVGLTLYSVVSTELQASQQQASSSIVPSFAESMRELQSLQNEINALQEQFAIDNHQSHIAFGNFANSRRNNHE